MANKTIDDLTTTTSAATTDFVPIWRASNGDTRKITKANFVGATFTGGGTLATGGFTLNVGSNSTINGSLVGNISGGGTIATGGFTLTVGANSTVNGSLVGSITGAGTIATGGFTLTVPATGTAVLLTEAQTITGVKTFSNGINLGNETLSVYDEGTFVPVVADASSAGNTATGTFAGRYVKIGKVVIAWISLANIVTSGMTGGNVLHVRALPFTAANISDFFFSGSVLASYVTISGGLQVTPLVIPNTAYIQLYEMITADTFAAITVSDISAATADIYIQITYLAAT